MRVTVPSATLREAIERIWAAGGEVVRVNPARRSLEDLFLELAQEKSLAAASGPMPASSNEARQ